MSHLENIFTIQYSVQPKHVARFEYQRIMPHLLHTVFFPFTQLLCSKVRKMRQNILSDRFCCLETHALLTWQMLVSFIMTCQMWYKQTYIC